MTRALLISIVSIAGFVLTGCEDGTTTPSTRTVTFRADLTDPAGDATALAGVTVIPDLRTATVEVFSDNRAKFSTRFAAATFNSATTFIQYSLDVDQNTATGSAFAGLGVEYVINLSAAANGALAEVRQFSGGSSFSLLSTAAVTFVSDGADVEIPLSLINGDDGKFNFRVTAQHQLSNTPSFSTILDYMPDLAIPVGTTR
jgi:hypothetical protein